MPMTAQRLEVVSPDGTRIVAEVSGEGPPLVVAHGTTGGAFSWALVAPHLSDRFRVYLVDRRGRGASGDGPEYSLEREAEDLVAVVEATGEPAVLVGHSFGGAVALEAALRTERLRALVLYEPPVEWPYPDGLIERMEALVATDRDEEALVVMLRETAHLSDEEVEAMRGSPAWALRVAAAPTIAREARADQAFALGDRFAELDVRALLLTGTDSAPDFRRSAEAVLAALPNARIRFLPGQGHAANVTAPRMLADEIVRFVDEVAGA